MLVFLARRTAGALAALFAASILIFAAVELLVMLFDSMIAEAAQKPRSPAVLVTVLGFAVAAALS